MHRGKWCTRCGSHRITYRGTKKRDYVCGACGNVMAFDETGAFGQDERGVTPNGFTKPSRYHKY